MSISAYEPACSSVTSVVAAPGAGAAAGEDLPADVGVRPPQQGHALRHRGRAALRVGLEHEVPLVAHHPADGEPRGAGGVGQPAGVLRRAAAAGQPDVDVDQHLAHPAVDGGPQHRVGVDGDGHPRAGVDDVAEAAHREHLVGQQQVLAQTGRGQPSTSRTVAQVKPVCPSAACRRASPLVLCALTCGRSRVPGHASAIIARLRSSAAPSTSSAGVVSSAASRGLPHEPITHEPSTVRR